MSTQPDSGSSQAVARPRPEPVAAGARGLPAVFLDRDGTLIEEVGYVNHLDRVRLYSWTAGAVRKLNEARVPAIAVTNQSGVARGYFSEELVRKVHEKIARELAAQSAWLDAFYYCPHHPNASLAAYRKECRCRKPAAGMLEEAAACFHLDLESSYVVGDTYRDMQMGFNAGARTVFVLTGYGRGELEYLSSTWPKRPDWIAENLLEAVDNILQDLARRPVASPLSESAPRGL
jgi:D-glycero-D-manno-heptose 1,7-bisphosphate phosphatase